MTLTIQLWPTRLVVAVHAALRVQPARVASAPHHDAVLVERAAQLNRWEALREHHRYQVEATRMINARPAIH